MLAILANRTYRALFCAQVIALLGTGLATVALALLVFDLAGEQAGMALGTALAIKMVAYVTLAPVAASLLERLPRRRVLVVLDLVRAGVALTLPFVSEVWQVYVLIFVLQAASAAFTPIYQATIPEILPDEKDYTYALSLSRLAYDLESLISPILAAALLSVLSFHDLFLATAFGFLASAAFIVSRVLPSPTPQSREGRLQRMGRGVRLFIATPRLRGVLAVNVAVAAAGAMVIVNTVVIVQGRFGLSETASAVAFAAFGGGSMLAALILPLLLERLSDRTIVLAGAVALAGSLALGPLADGFAPLLPLWVVLGAGFTAAQMPTGRLLRRSSHAPDRPALFAAQFALSHAAWLLLYPLAGWLHTAFGLNVAFGLLAVIAGLALLVCLRLWPRDDAEELEHDHHDLPEGDPHWHEGEPRGGRRHSHAFVIDDLHTRWPLQR